MPRLRTIPRTIPQRVLPRKRARTQRYSRNTGPSYGGISSGKTFSKYSGKDPFRPTYKCKLHYAETFTFTSGAGGICGTEQAMSINNLYDPNLTGGGHQPYCFDQLAALYGRYIVKKVSFDIDWSDPSGDGMFVVAMLQGNSSGTALTGMTRDRVTELPFCASAELNNTGSQIEHFKKTISIWELLGITKTQYMGSSTLYGAAVGTNPSVPVYLRFSCGSIRGTAGDTVIGQVRIIFDCEFYDRITQNQS